MKRKDIVILGYNVFGVRSGVSSGDECPGSRMEAYHLAPNLLHISGSVATRNVRGLG